jgi:hypothetical protein
LHPHRFTRTMDVLRATPELSHAFAATVGKIGLEDAA